MKGTVSQTKPPPILIPSFHPSTKGVCFTRGSISLFGAQAYKSCCESDTKISRELQVRWSILQTPPSISSRPKVSVTDYHLSLERERIKLLGSGTKISREVEERKQRGMLSMLTKTT